MIDDFLEDFWVSFKVLILLNLSFMACIALNEILKTEDNQEGITLITCGTIVCILLGEIIGIDDNEPNLIGEDLE
jgi:hypothetical protein